MSLLNLPTKENATGEVKKIFDEMQSMLGMVPNGMKLWSANPKALQMQWAVMKAVMHKDKEEQKLYAMIRYLVSDKNSCSYCIGFNSTMLINIFGLSQDDLIELQKDPSTASLNPKNKALLLLAMQSVKDPDSVCEEDIKKLKHLGITEMEMFNIVHTVGKMMLVNTLFKAFKVQQD